MVEGGRKRRGKDTYTMLTLIKRKLEELFNSGKVGKLKFKARKIIRVKEGALHSDK